MGENRGGRRRDGGYESPIRNATQSSRTSSSPYSARGKAGKDKVAYHFVRIDDCFGVSGVSVRCEKEEEAIDGGKESWLSLYPSLLVWRRRMMRVLRCAWKAGLPKCPCARNKVWDLGP